MSKICIAPTGRLIEGHVLDCARRPLEAKLREYDAQLYLKWNPKKLQGHGLWELRRRPETKLPVDYAVFEGNLYTRLEYKEFDIVNHVKDFAYLNYRILVWVKANDHWSNSYKAKNYVRDLEYKEAKVQERLENKAEAEKQYMIKQHRSQIKDFMQFVQSGGNPYRIADFWGKLG